MRFSSAISNLVLLGVSSVYALNLNEPFPSRSQRGRDFNNNGSTFLWTLVDNYAGKTFFDTWDFFTYPDPTHGLVNFVNSTYAFANNLSTVLDNGKVMMKGDDTTWLADGEYRDSVRITSKKIYNGGLFILDLDRAPWGCGVWPAFWTVGGNWPYQGEIDVIEGVHDNEHNQVTWHTGPDCYLTPSTTNYTGTNVQTSNYTCWAYSPSAGCGVTEWSHASYGPYFESQGGGAFAMKWDENGIAVWSFYRSAIPNDITLGAPNTSAWGLPVAVLEPGGCDLASTFVNHSIIFDITFCGDWAGNSYATTTCPGTCTTQLMNPGNFINASWIINSLKVYQKIDLTGPIAPSGSNPQRSSGWVGWLAGAASLVVMIFTML